MMKAVLGLPLAQAKALLAGKDCEAEFTRRPAGRIKRARRAWCAPRVSQGRCA